MGEFTSFRRSYKSAWYSKNRKRILAMAKRRYRLNRAARLKYVKDYAAKNVVSIRAYKKAWRKQRGLGTDTIGKRYGIAVAEYAEMEKAQHGRCYLCGQKNGKRKLCVDHDHGTDAIRKLLCGKCNGGLGMFLENPDLLRRAAAYLEAHRRALQGA